MPMPSADRSGGGSFDSSTPGGAIGDPEGVREVREYWERFWSQALAGFKAVADTEAEQRLAGALNIMSIPTLMIIRDKVIVFSQAGALPKSALQDVIGQARALDMDKARADIAAQGAET